MNKKILVAVPVVIAAIIIGSYFYFESSPRADSTSLRDSDLKTYTFPQESPLPGLMFSYPGSLGDVDGSSQSKALARLKFNGGNTETSSLKIISTVDDSLGTQTFQQWIAGNYGYVPGNPHNPQLSDDTSIASFTTIAGKEALKVTALGGDPNHSLYLLNLGNGSVLVFAIQGAPLSDAARDQIANSIKIN